MNRRQFLSIGGGLLILTACRNSEKDFFEKKEYEFPIQLDSNRAIGHLAHSAISMPVSEIIKTETLVVGAGIAGLSAACSLASNDFMICELSTDIGGTSGAISINKSLYTQGAHYDLAYPTNFGTEGLELLEKLNIISFSSINNQWEFIEKQHLISKKEEEACYINGEMRPTILPKSELRKNMFSLFEVYEDEFPLPTTLIDSKWNHLDKITFFDYLNKYLPITSDFIEAIDYQLLDDYGGTSKQISALAGIHYYKCRPYEEDEKRHVELFSPLEGNYYFIQKMMKKIDAKNLFCNHLVFGLQQQKDKWLVDVLDTKSMTKKSVIAKNVIYAGQKNSLKYVHPKSYPTFSDVSYTPWVVINFELDDIILENTKWQNDFMSPDASFLGFVDSKVQNATKTRVLTVYYCFPDVHHYVVQKFEETHKSIVHNALEKIGTYYGKDVSKHVKKAYVKLLGHAMPLPKPGYMTKSRELITDNLAFAGVDTGRLPLLFDAMDSGIQATKRILV